MARGVGLGRRRATWLVAVLALATGCASQVRTVELPVALSQVAPGSTPVTTLPGVPPPVGAVDAEAEADAIAPPPATFAGPAATAPAPSLPAGPAGGGVWSLVVGIDDYPGRASDLRSAVNDAADVDLLLARAGVPPEQRLHLVDGEATAAVLRRALDWLVARAGPDATAVIFFAGHVRQLGDGVEALIAADGHPVADHEVAARLAGLQARQTWIVLATCFGGGFTEVVAPGRILTAAAPAGRLAYENLDLRRSYLVEYLVRRALLEGRAGTVEAAFAWAEAAIDAEHPGRAPVQFDALDGDLDLGAAPVATRPPPPPPPAPRRPTPPRPAAAPPPDPPADEEERSCGPTLGTLLHCPED